MRPHLLPAGLVLLGVGLLMAGWLLVQERVVAPWFVGVATAGGLIAFVSARSLAERRGRRREEPDALSAYRGYRAARVVRLQAGEAGPCDLLLELFPDRDFEGDAVTLRFHGVRDLVVNQLGEVGLHFDYLLCDERVVPREAPRCLRVRDRWREAIEFRCQSFEEVGRCTSTVPEDRSSESGD